MPPTLALPPPEDSPFFSSPSLICSWRSNPIKIFHPLYNQFYHVNPLQNIPEDAMIYCSSYGWLLVSTGDHHSLCFINPLTGQREELPRSMCIFQTMSFFSPPSSSNWSIIGVSDRFYRADEIGILNEGRQDGNFTHVILKFVFGLLAHLFYLEVSTTSWVMKGWLVFWILRISKAVGKSFKSLKRLRRSGLYRSFMVEVGEQLVAVFVTDDERKVHVKKLNLLSMVWEPLQDLGDKILYTSLRGSSVKIAWTKSMANTIYFPNFYENNGVFYSLTTGKYHSMDGKFCSGKVHRLTEREFGMWFQPSPDATTEQLQMRWMDNM